MMSSCIQEKDNVNTINTEVLTEDLTEDLTVLVWKAYFTHFVLKSINDTRISRFNDIKAFIVNLQTNYNDSISNSDIQNANLTDKNIETIWDLTDIGDYRNLSYIYNQNKNSKYAYAQGYGYYHWFTIAITLERFYSNTLLEQQQHIANANTFASSYIFQNGYSEYFQKIYNNFIDYKDMHSGATYGYCVSTISGFIMKNKQEKLNLWALTVYNNVISNFVL